MECNEYGIPENLEQGIECRRWLQTDTGDYKDGGVMKLIEPKENWRKIEPFPLYYCEEIGQQVNVTKEMWKVELKEDYFSTPIITTTWVYVKHSYGIVHIPDETDDIDNKLDELEDSLDDIEVSKEDIYVAIDSLPVENFNDRQLQQLEYIKERI